MVALVVKNSPARGLIPGKIPWGRTWKPTPVFLPKESMNRGAWLATVYRVTKGRRRLKQLSAAHKEDHFLHEITRLRNCQFSSVAQSCPTLCDPMNLSMPGLPVHHQLPEFTQPQVHRVSDAIQSSHPLLSPSPPASNPSQHQSLFQ